MKEEDRKLLERMKEVEDFIDLCESLNREGIVYDVLDLAKQYEMIHSPFAILDLE